MLTGAGTRRACVECFGSHALEVAAAGEFEGGVAAGERARQEAAAAHATALRIPMIPGKIRKSCQIDKMSMK